MGGRQFHKGMRGAASNDIGDSGPRDVRRGHHAAPMLGIFNVIRPARPLMFFGCSGAAHHSLSLPSCHLINLSTGAIVGWVSRASDCTQLVVGVPRTPQSLK